MLIDSPEKQFQDRMIFQTDLRCWQTYSRPSKIHGDILVSCKRKKYTYMGTENRKICYAVYSDQGLDSLTVSIAIRAGHKVSWVLGYFELNGPFRQCFSLYRR